MILVSALYIVCHLLQAVLYLQLIAGLNFGFHPSAYDVSRFIQFLYVTANPFIYALKFGPVKKVLKGMIPSRTSAWFDHVRSRVISIGNRTSSAPNDHELGDMSGRE